MSFTSNIFPESENNTVNDTEYICMYDKDLNVIDCCTNYTTLYGTDASTLIGKSFKEIHTNSSNRRRAQFEKVLLTGAPSSIAISFTSTTNEIVYVEEQIHRLNSGLAIVGKNITKNKEEQEAKEEQEYVLSLIARHSEQIFLLIDIEGKILFIDKTYPQFTMEEVIGSSIYRYLNEENKRIIKDCMAAVLRTKKNSTYEISTDVRNGKNMFFEGIISPIIESGVVVKLSVITKSITERKKIENELKVIKEQYVNLLKLTKSLSFNQDKALRITSVLSSNRLSEELLLGKTDRELIHPFTENNKNVEAAKLEVIQTGKAKRMDVEINLNNELFHYDLLIQPLFNEEQETIGINCTSINITERVIRKETLEKSERRLREAEEISKLGYYDIDLSTGDLNWSEETYRIFNVDSNDYIPNLDNFLDLVYEEDRDHVFDTMQKIRTSGKDVDLNYRLLGTNGVYKYVRDLAKAKFNTEGRVTRIFGTTQDITQQVTLELELKEQKAFIQRIVDSSPSLIFILDIEKKENIFINNASEQLLGYTKEEVRKNHNLFLNQLSNISLAAVENNVLNKEAATFLSFIHPAERELFIEFIHVFVEDKSDRVFDLNFRHQHKEGKWMWLHHRLISFNRNDKGKVTQLLGIVSDITSLKEAEKKSKMAMIEGQEKERRRIAKDLHDAINPLLSAAKLNVESLQCQNTKNEQQTNISNVVSLLSQSMDEIKEISFNLMPSILKDFGLTFTLKDYCNKITAGGVLKVNLDIHGIERRLGEVKEIMIFRIAQELINNVIKHANASQLEVQLIAHQKTIVLMVEDNGKGLEDTITISSSKGYGLKNVESRVKTLNGAMDIDALKNRGTIVTIEIPRK